MKNMQVLFVLSMLGASVYAGAFPTCPLIDSPLPVYIPSEDCTKVWQCSNGVAFLINCSPDLKMITQLRVCDCPLQVQASDDGQTKYNVPSYTQWLYPPLLKPEGPEDEKPKDLEIVNNSDSDSNGDGVNEPEVK